MVADKDKIWRAVLEIGTCMLVTRDGAMLRARPMQALAEPDENAVWFLSDREAHTDVEIAEQSQVCLSFADVNEDLYVSLSGPMAVIDDAERVASLLADDDTADDDDRLEAKDLVALKFMPELGEIWDGWSLAEEDDDDQETEDDSAANGGESTSVKVAFGKGKRTSE